MRSMTETLQDEIETLEEENAALRKERDELRESEQKWKASAERLEVCYGELQNMLAEQKLKVDAFNEMSRQVRAAEAAIKAADTDGGDRAN